MFVCAVRAGGNGDKGDPELETNPFGLLPRGMIVYALDSAGKDLYGSRRTGSRA